MRVRYDELIPALKSLLSEKKLDLIGRVVAFIRRLREIRASVFVWSVVLSRFGHGRPGFEQARQWYARLGGVELWPRPFQVRFKSPAAVQLFERAFEDAVQPWRRRRRARHMLARAFPDVVAVDSTLLQLDDALRPIFKGARGAASSLKALLTISVFGLVPLHAALVAGHQHDMRLFPPLDTFVKGTLLLFDKGFVAYDRLREIQAAAHHYLCPMRLNGNAIVLRARRAPKYVRKALRAHPEGVWLRDLLPADKRIRKPWDLEVALWPKTQARSRQQVRTRLVIVPGPKSAQRPYLTSLTARAWPPRALAELYRLRWQVELVFKELKQDLNLASIPTKDPHAAQVFVWASLVALALSRTVATWLVPLASFVGLGASVRPAVLSRALRSHVRLLARALTATARDARLLLELLADDLLAESRQLQPERDDSFQRLIPLLPRSAAA